jgi:mercuric ion binding protein
MKISVLPTAVLAAMLAGGLLADGAALAGARATSHEATAEDAVAKFKIDRMTCASCPIAVKKAMMRVEGVKSVEIDFGSNTATVAYDPNATTPDAIAQASTAVGYPAAEI